MSTLSMNWKNFLSTEEDRCNKYMLFLLVFILSIFLKISPVFYVLFCAAAGIVFTRMGVRGK